MTQVDPDQDPDFGRIQSKGSESTSDPFHFGHPDPDSKNSTEIMENSHKINQKQTNILFNKNITLLIRHINN